MSDDGGAVFAAVELAIDSEVQIEYTPSFNRGPVRVRAVVRNRRGYVYGLEFLPRDGVEEQILLTLKAMLLSTGTRVDGSLEDRRWPNHRAEISRQSTVILGIASSLRFRSRHLRRRGAEVQAQIVAGSLWGKLFATQTSPTPSVQTYFTVKLTGILWVMFPSLPVNVRVKVSWFTDWDASKFTLAVAVPFNINEPGLMVQVEWAGPPRHVRATFPVSPCRDANVTV
jgi:hypothetical protein